MDAAHSLGVRAIVDRLRSRAGAYATVTIAAAAALGALALGVRVLFAVGIADDDRRVRTLAILTMLACPSLVRAAASAIQRGTVVTLARRRDVGVRGALGAVLAVWRPLLGVGAVAILVDVVVAVAVVAIVASSVTSFAPFRSVHLVGFIGAFVAWLLTRSVLGISTALVVIERRGFVSALVGGARLLAGHRFEALRVRWVLGAAVLPSTVVFASANSPWVLLTLIPTIPIVVTLDGIIEALWLERERGSVDAERLAAVFD